MIIIYASALADAGHHVTIKTNQVKTIFQIHPLVHIEHIGIQGKSGTILSAMKETLDADLVIADIIALSCMLYVRNGRKVIYFAQDYDESYYTNFLQKLFIRTLYYLGLSFFRIKTIAVSHPLAKQLRSRFGAEVSIVENGVDTAIFFPDPDPDLVAAKQGRKAILLLSRSDYRKGFDIGLQVVSRLHDRLHNCPWEVWTVGENAAGKMGDISHRNFGFVNEERLRRIMSSADLFLYPSRHEGFPLMVLEAFACRCPVVTTDAVPYAVHSVNAMVSKIEDVGSLCENVLSYLKGQEQEKMILENAFRYALEHSQASSTERFVGRLVELNTLEM